MGGAADLDVALDRRGLEGVKQPARILVRDHAVPFATDERDRRLHQRGIVTEIAVPGVNDVVERAGRNLDPDRIATAAARIAVETALTPVVEMRTRKHGRLVLRHVLGEAGPLRLERDDLPGGRARRLLVASRRSTGNRAEQYEAVDQRRVCARKPRGGNRAPRMGEEREARRAFLVENKANRRRELLARLHGAAERRIGRRRLVHLGIAVGSAEAVEVEPPHVEARLA